MHIISHRLIGVIHVQNKYFSDVSQPSLGVEHELTMNAMGEMDTETPAMRASMVSVHQRSPGGMHGQMETHWEENNGPACRYFNKHFTRSVNLHIGLSLLPFPFPSTLPLPPLCLIHTHI